MFKTFTLLAALFLALAMPASVRADDKKTPPMPAPLQTMVSEGAQIRYLGNDGGLDGWVTIKEGQEQYFYATPDQQYLVMGVLFNGKGDAVTLRQINALRKTEGPAIDRLAGFEAPIKPKETEERVKPDFDNPKALLDSAQKSKSEQLFEGAEKSNFIALGDSKAPIIYTFVDPECPHCHDMIQDVRKSGFLDRGLLQLRLIPVGLMSEESLREAAFLLAAPNAKEVLFKHLDGDKKALDADPGINTQGVQRNMMLMQDWKLDVTPFSIYKDAKGTIKILRGRPNDLKKVVMELR